MKPVYVVSDGIVSPLGWDAESNFGAVLAGRGAIREQRRPLWSDAPFQAALFDDETLDARFEGLFPNISTTRFEKMAALSIAEALLRSPIPASGDGVVFILSTTKGNISLLESQPATNPELSLHHSARRLARQFGIAAPPLVVAHACISGVAALLLGKRLLESGRYRHAVVCGADEVSRFVWSGFQSFQALSDAPCRPFDSRRNGLNLGEGSATFVLSTDPGGPGSVRLAGGAVSNDANHISGPSRSGAELAQAVLQALSQSGLHAADVGFISAHGTATVYNDEMEAKAFDLAGLSVVPLNSLKGYFGHTLGAAGLIESAVSIRALRADRVPGTLGFETPGVSRPVGVQPRAVAGAGQVCLKTASGFGGCNAAVVFRVC